MRVQDKDILAQTASLVALAYSTWGHSLVKPSTAILTPKRIDGRLDGYEYLSKEALTNRTKKIMAKDKKVEPASRYLIDVPSRRVEEALFPDLSKEFQNPKVAHFWGHTGFARDSIYPSEDSKVNQEELKKAAPSYMGSVILSGPKNNPKEQTLNITFRGSRGGSPAAVGQALKGQGEGNPDWVSDLDLGKSIDVFKRWIGLANSVDIHNHAGMTKAYYSCRQEILSALKELNVTLPFPGKIVITGHSLGGGLATLCAYDICGGFQLQENHTRFPKSKKLLGQVDAKQVHCVTYSAPAVGNAAFAKSFNELVPNYKRVLINTDPITIETCDLFHPFKGKLDLVSAAAAELKEKVPDYLVCGSRIKINPSAHDPSKLIELVQNMTGREPIALIRTISKLNFSLHAEFDSHITSAINAALPLKSNKDIKKLIESLESLTNLNNLAIQYCVTSRHHNKDIKMDDYKKNLQEIIKTIKQTINLIPKDSAQLRKVLVTFTQLQQILEKEQTRLASQKSVLDEKPLALEKSALQAGSLFNAPAKRGEVAVSRPGPRS